MRDRLQERPVAQVEQALGVEARLKALPRFGGVANLLVHRDTLLGVTAALRKRGISTSTKRNPISRRMVTPPCRWQSCR
jgi:hypothetical protein